MHQRLVYSAWKVVAVTVPVSNDHLPGERKVLVVTSRSPVQLASDTLGPRLPSLGDSSFKDAGSCQRPFYFPSSSLLASNLGFACLCFFGAGITAIVPLYPDPFSLKIFFLCLYLLYAYKCFSCMYVCGTSLLGARRSQKRASELQKG